MHCLVRCIDKVFVNINENSPQRVRLVEIDGRVVRGGYYFQRGIRTRPLYPEKNVYRRPISQ